MPDARRSTEAYRTLARLSAETAARLHAGDDDFLEEALARRAALLTTIRALPLRAEHAEDVKAAIGDVLALDQQLGALLEARRDEVHRELTELAEKRAALHSYRGSPAGAVFVDRLS